VNRASKKSLLTVRERVLLHLLAFQKYNQDADAPRSVTQDGIAQGTDVGRNNITKVVTDLSDEGLVETQNKRVKGLTSMRKVYFLTSEGFQDALALKRQIESTRIVITKMDGERVEDEVGKLPMFLPKQYQFLELVMGVSHGQFDCQSFHEGKMKEERRFVDYTDRKPAIRSFHGREGELQKLSNFLSSDAKLLVVRGIAGIGKTTLLAKFAQDHRDQTNIFWFKMHEWVDAKAMLRPLGEFFSQLGRKGLEFYLTQVGSVNIGEVCHVMETELRETSAVLIMDDVQKANKDTMELLSAILGVLESLPNTKMLCTSREVPLFYARSQVVRGVVQELVLEGLDKESSLRLMRERALPEASLEALYRITNGHPLFMELVEDPGYAMGKSVRMFLEQEIYSKLDVSEKHILEIASIFRYPVPTDAFFALEDEILREQNPPAWDKSHQDHKVDYDTIERLMRDSLLLEYAERTVGMHDMMREFFYGRLAPRSRLQLHEAASRYFLQDSSAPSNVEALYHSMLANDCVTSVQIAAGNGREIISKGYSSLFSPLLDDLLFRCGGIEASDRMEILLLQAEIKDVQGEWDQAMRRYEDIMRLTSPERDKRIRAEVCRRMGVIQLRRYSYDEAMDLMNAAKEIAESIPDQQTLAQVLYDMGGVMERRGATEEAIQFFQESEHQAEEIGEDVFRGKALYGLGRAYAQQREMGKAIALKRLALEVLEKTGDANEIAKVCSSLGNDLLNEGAREEAIGILERSVGLANSIGDLNTMGYTLANLAAFYIEVGNLDRAEVLLDQASQISMKLNEQYLIAALHLYRGYLYHKRGEWDWAKESFSTALEELRALHAPTRLSHWLHEVGKVYSENAEYEGARALLVEAREIARSTGQSGLLAQIDETLQGIGL